MQKYVRLATTLLVVSLALHCAPLQARSVDGAFRAAIQYRYNREMLYYTIVPYKNRYFGESCGTSQAMRNQNGVRPHIAIWEYVNGHWSFIFDFYATVDADEGALELNRLFARYQFSPNMRQKLMYGPERRVY